MSRNSKKQIVHANRLKIAQNSEAWKPKREQKAARKRPKKPTTCINEEEEKEIRTGKFPLWKEIRLASRTESGTRPDQILNTSEKSSKCEYPNLGAHEPQL